MKFNIHYAKNNNIKKMVHCALDYNIYILFMLS